MGEYWLVLEREEFKFSCAHMTIFDDGSKERMHGHNYRVKVRAKLRNQGSEKLVPFADIKAGIRSLCKDWKEYLLLPADNPLVKVVSRDDKEIEFTVCGERYVLPTQDVKLLPIQNVTVECLSAYVAKLLREYLGDVSASMTALEVTVTESPGQGCTYQIDL